MVFRSNAGAWWKCASSSQISGNAGGVGMEGWKLWEEVVLRRFYAPIFCWVRCLKKYDQTNRGKKLGDGFLWLQKSSVGVNGIQIPSPKLTASLHLKIGLKCPKRKGLIFQPSISRCKLAGFVSGRVNVLPPKTLRSLGRIDHLA